MTRSPVSVAAAAAIYLASQASGDKKTQKGTDEAKSVLGKGLTLAFKPENSVFRSILAIVPNVCQCTLARGAVRSWVCRFSQKHKTNFSTLNVYEMAPIKRKTWHHSAMIRAVDAVRSNQIGYLKASKQFGVPKDTPEKAGWPRGHGDSLPLWGTRDRIWTGQDCPESGDMTDIGYKDLGICARKLYIKRLQLLNETKRLRIQHKVPPVYPNGWIPLLESRDLTFGESKPVTALGQQFVIFRGKTGKCFVLDAYCPHLGAHLGLDGKVYEDCIECPFHGWRFSGQDGSCVKIPYAKKISEVAKIKSWETIEQNGFIYVWHHAEGQPPLWKPPVIPEIEKGSWHYKGRSEHIINCHIQEITENGADFAHFNCLHKFGITAGIILHPENWWKFFQNIWNFSFTQIPEPNFHCSKYIGNTDVKLFGISVAWTSFNVQQIGPAIFHTYLKSSLGSGVFVQCIIPEGPFRQRFVRHYYSPYRFSTLFDHISLFTESHMIERDVRIWNYKMYWKNPVYVSEDKKIVKFRKWYAQFYSENSPKAEEEDLNW
ncbi:cholesterol 7-desaturase-like [Centruroides sculpturatus]|uniref:cholesterol 7-desaturase-like n=1 Tax=Centruroides sculpturatus TaxID=218467 RepID=UPI000C6F004D|nr:cholesterol 7-desaturase-like [Centruroides sculpturatus]